MNARITLPVVSLFALVLATPNMASAIELKNTSYPIPKNAYFVSPNGKNNNSGKSPRSPWTVEKAINKAPNGSTIVFRGGIYRNIDTGINKRLTLQAYPHEKPWLKGSVVVKGWVREGNKWRKDGWNYSFPRNMGNEHIDPKYPLAGNGDMVYVNGVSLKQVGNKANVVPGTFYVDYSQNKLYIGNNPQGKTVESTALKEGFNLWQNRYSKPSGTIIRGLGFAHYAQTSIFMGAPRITLENNTFVWNGEQGVKFGSNAQGKADDATVRGNTFSYNGQLGLGGQADGLLFEGNLISFNNIENFKKTWNAAGAKFIKSSGAVLRNNTVENNFSTGIWLDLSCLNTTIANNAIRNNESIGIFYELSHKGLITGNTVYNNGAGIMLADSSGSQVSNNTLINNKHKVPIILKDSSRLNKNRAEMAQGIMWITHNNVIKNNNMN